MKFYTFNKAYRTHGIRIGTAALSLVFILAPVLSSAQTANGTFYRGQLSQEGAGDPGSGVQQWRGHWQQSSEMQQKISALPSVATPAVTMPVLFGVGIKDISPNFGDPRPNGRTHEGEDIMAVKGTPIVSPTQAVVLRAENGVSEGNAVYTANPGGETFVYMHLDRFGEGVTAGTVLAPGSLIGYVGNTGDAAGGAAHLHFEIHNTSGAPTDPYPRLTMELTLQQKMFYLTPILAQTSDSGALSNFLVTNFRRTFTDAIAQNISLPTSITNALATIPASTPPTSGGASLPAGDLDVGSAGAAVVALQTYLIQSAKGAAALSLSRAGATGNFGAITKAALVEFQTAVRINPADGYYGSATRTYIETHPASTTVTQPSAPTVPSAPVSTTPAVFTRDLKQGMSGTDVLALQKLLNTKAFTVAASGPGSPGSETSYFGPATTAAVIKFQTAHSIVPSAGYFGPITRAALAAI